MCVNIFGEIFVKSRRHAASFTNAAVWRGQELQEIHLARFRSECRKKKYEHAETDSLKKRIKFFFFIAGDLCLILYTFIKNIMLMKGTYLGEFEEIVLLAVGI